MKNYLKWAVFTSAVGIVFALVMYVAGISNDLGFAWLRWVSMVIGLALIFMGVREKKMEDPAGFTFGKGWVATFMICLLTGVISAIWIFVYTSSIDSGMIDMQLQASRQALAAQQNMTHDQLDQAMKVTSFFVSPTGFAITTVIAYVFGGAILGLIISPIVKAVGNKNIPPAEPQPGM